MTLQYTPYILPLAVSSAFGVAMLILAWRNRAEAVAPWFAATVVALLAWSIGYMLELTATSLAAKILWANLEYVATLALPLFWLQVVLIFIRRRGLPRPVWIVLGLAAAAILAGVFANPWHLFRGTPALVTHGSLLALRPDYGPIWSFGWVPFVYGMLIAAAYLLVRSMLCAPRFQVRHSLALLVASLLPLAAGTLYAIGLSPWPDYNPAMAVVSLSGLLMAYALFSSRLFELAPLARGAVIENLADAVLVVDRHGRLVDVNPAARSAFPELGEGCVGKRLTVVLNRRQDVVDVLEETLAILDVGADTPAPRWPRELEVGGGGVSESARRVYSMLTTPVRSGSGTALGLAIVMRDVSERVGLLNEAVRLATTDGLTGVLTRRRFLELGEQAVRRAARRRQPLTLIIFDVDRLKQINDSLGHAAGDKVLMSIAAASRGALREGDLIGRLGGDEFCALLPGADREEGRRIAERMHVAAGSCWHTSGEHLVDATVSIGVATSYAVGEGDLATLLEAADQALYAAKAGGRDRIATAPGAPVDASSSAPLPRPALPRTG